MPSVRDAHRSLATGRYPFRPAMRQAVAAHDPQLAPAEVEAKCGQVVDRT